MTTQTDIWRAAKQYVDLYGENAELEAGIRIDASLAQGDLTSNERWHRVLRAIQWLKDNRGRDPFKVEH